MTFPKINTKRSIRLVRDHDAKVTIVGTRINGDIIIDGQDEDGRVWLETVTLTPDGIDPTARTIAPIIENVPQISSGFYAYGGNGFYGRGLTSLDMAKEDFSSAECYVEVIRRDGVPVDVKLHKK